MKNTIAVLLVMGALFSGNTMFATGNHTEPLMKPAKNMQVAFDNVSTDSKLYIKDSFGQTLFSEDINSAGKYNRAFDLSALPSDDYYFEIDKKAFISILPFTVLGEMVELHVELASEIVKPVLILEDDKVKLMRTLDQEQSIKVKIYYEGQNLVFSETIDNDGMIERIYDLSTSSGGEYLFSIDYEDYNFSEYLSINSENY